MRALPILACASLLATSLGACSRNDTTAPEPQGEAVGAAMPDTSQPTMAPNAPGEIAAPDAGATGVVPADGSPPPVQPPTTDQPPALPPT